MMNCLNAHVQSVPRLAKGTTGKRTFLLCDAEHGMRRVKKADVSKLEEEVCTLFKKTFGTEGCKVIHYACRACNVQQ